MPDESRSPLPPAPVVRRCRDCFYVIDHLPSQGRCPECGATYDLADPATYTLKPPFVWWTFWLPGLITSAVCGLILYAALIPFFGYGWTTVLAIPAVAGVTLGYRTRASRIIVNVVLGFWLIAILLLGLLTMNLAGSFCAMVLGAIAFLPALAGMGIGIALRTILKRSSFAQRSYLPLLTLMLIPPSLCLIEGRHTHMAIVSTSTSLVIAAPPDKAWNAIHFYEEVKHAPPWLLRITPTFRPMYTLGSSQHVGDVKVCVYERGRLVKQVTEIVPGKRLAFRVIEQTDIQNRGVRLIDGSFDLAPTADGRGTTVTLTTRYEPNLAPRFAFLPAESLAVHTLHEHVLRGMKDKGERP